MHVMAHLKAFIILKANLTSDFAVFHFFNSVIEKLDVYRIYFDLGAGLHHEG